MAKMAIILSVSMEGNSLHRTQLAPTGDFDPCDLNRSKSACDKAVTLGTHEFGSVFLGTLGVLGFEVFSTAKKIVFHSVWKGCVHTSVLKHSVQSL